MKPKILAALLAIAPALSSEAALAQQNLAISMTVGKLLAQGYDIKAASSSGQQQFIYLERVDPAGRKTAYACELEFGSNGGSRGCLALP